MVAANIEDRMENTGSEHRRYTRHQCTLPVQLHCPGQSYPTSGETTDVSLRGCYIKLSFPLPVGTQVDVRIGLPDGQFKAKGVIRTLDPALGNGLEFTDVEPRARQELERCLQTFPLASEGGFDIIR
jgi:PilZ domain